LRRLSEHGWKITVIGEHGQDTTACVRAGWQVQQLPLRRSWWPPFRPDSAISRRLRTWLLGRECRALTSSTGVDAIFGYLAAHADFSPEIAAQFARQSRRPLSLLIHDDAAAFGRDREEKKRLRARHNWIIGQAYRAWFVSPELAAEYDLPQEKRRVLLPIPEGWGKAAEWQPAFAEQARVYYAGHIWPPQYPLLAKISRALNAAGGKLVLLSKDTPELRAFIAAESAEWIQPFPTNREALSHLAGSAAGLLVSYAETVEEMPWIATSFPSKFIEYSHLGLPCAIVAPPESSVGRWAQRESYPHFYPPGATAEFADWAAGLRRQDTWTNRANVPRELAKTLFNPELIQRQWEDTLLR
jgi:hypothetical protein